MKKAILLLFLMSAVVKGQNLDNLINSYKPSQKQLIKENWTQYFKEDISSLYTTKNIYSIRLDSYGLMYPFTNILDSISTRKMRHNGQRAIKNTKYSLVNIFGKKSLRKKLVLNKVNPSGKDHFYDSLAAAVGPYKLDLENFNILWRKFHESRTINEINALVTSKTYTKVIFYCHGYNVPYSLAALQFEYIIRHYELDDGKTLFVPIYWPSNDAKKFKTKLNGKLNYKDKKVPSNAVRFLYYSNQAYFAGLTLRAIINNLSDSIKDVKIVSHSLGTTVSTQALINSIGKLHGDTSAIINAQLIKLMNVTPIPGRKISVYLSAAAIPGMGTFNSFSNLSSNHVFYCSWNKKDKVLNKNFFKIKVGADRLGSTELGLNYQGSVNSVEAFMNMQVQNSFISENVTDQEDHDIFSYLKNSKYEAFMSRFFKTP